MSINKTVIGMVLENEYPPDIRVSKESSALIAAGMSLHLLCKAQDGCPADEVDQGMHIHRWVHSGSAWRKAFHTLVARLTFVHPVWRKALIKYVETYDIQVLHVHDLPLVKTALTLKKVYPDIKIVADLHENMPAAYRAYRVDMSIGRKIISALFLNYWVWRRYESKILSQCDRIIVVVPEAAERLLNDGIPEDRIHLVSNTEDETTFNTDSDYCDKNILERYRNKWVALYIGGIGPHRGLDIALQALPYIGTRIKGFKLLVVGANTGHKRNIEEQARTLGVLDMIEVIGWQPFEKVTSYMFASKVCLVPHNSFEHTRTTVPHKLFQYMLCGRPVLVSDCRPLERIVTETDSGYIFTAGDASDLASKLLFIEAHPEDAEKKGRNGRNAALGTYGWQHDAQRLLELYASLTGALS